MKAKKQKRKKIKIFSIFFAMFLAIFITIYSFSNKMLVKIGEASYKAILSTSSYYALEENIKSGFDFEEMFFVDKNNNGDIIMFATNSLKFNILTSNIVNSVANYLTNYTKSGVDVPIGVFTGISLLSGFGKSVKMPLISVNSVKCDILSTFESAGINQTKHSLYINIIPDVSIVTRVTNKNVSDTITVLIYENLIVGKVPDVYLAGSVFSAEKYI